jgi:hypothetical protein
MATNGRSANCRPDASGSPLDNGGLECARPAVRQAVCDALDAAAIEQFFARWHQQIPFPLTAQVARGFAYQLSILHAEVSLTQVVDRPLRGRECFETILRDNLDLGRPDRVQLLFPRRITRTTPGRFSTHVITKGVNRSVHIAYKHCRIKQYFKEERALRTETTFTLDSTIKTDTSSRPTVDAWPSS